MNAVGPSGGVGCLVRETLLVDFHVSVLDISYEGITWLKLENKSGEGVICLAVCYLPPSNSTRHVNAPDFFDTLLGNIHEYQQLGLTVICRDFNSRIGDMPDCIERVDAVPPRDVVDYQPCSSQGELLLEFLTSAEFCVLNGRNCIQNDFTCVSARGASVVDYCLVAHEQLHLFNKFKVVRARSLFEAAGCIARRDPQGVISDHSILLWMVDISHFGGQQQSTVQPKQRNIHEQTRYDVSNIQADFLQSDEVATVINNLIQSLETETLSQENIDSLYQEFCETIISEMSAVLPARRVTLKSAHSNKRRRAKKPWWNESLTLMWNNVCEAERVFLRCKGADRARLRQQYRQKQKQFDKEIRAAKRRHWNSIQQNLLDKQRHDPQHFWKEIGQLGVAQERKLGIPMEVVLPDGSVSTRQDAVLSHWKNGFRDLLNDSGDADEPVEDPVPDLGAPELSTPITVEEVRLALTQAKRGKAPGVDSIPVEVLQNGPSLHFLHNLFATCFQRGLTPSQWANGVIKPIPKSTTGDPREPSNYRGITLASSVYKLYCHILNARLMHWAESNDILEDEQNGFRRGRSTVDHLSTLSSIVETRKLKGQSTFVAFIDFQKAYDRIQRPLLWA